MFESVNKAYEAALAAKTAAEKRHDELSNAWQSFRENLRDMWTNLGLPDVKIPISEKVELCVSEKAVGTSAQVTFEFLRLAETAVAEYLSKQTDKYNNQFVQ